MQVGLRFFINYYWMHKLDHTTLYPGVREGLERMANGHAGGHADQRRKLAVLTNKPVYPSQGIIDDLGLGRLFYTVYGGNSFHSKKPDPVGVHALLRETGVGPREAMMVGDSDVDMETGFRAGIWTCAVTYGFGTLSLDANAPDLVVDNLLELADALDENQGRAPA
jgi:phosphoglycolate phosphatase